MPVIGALQVSVTYMSQNQQQPPSIPPYQGGSLASDECNGKGVYHPPLTRGGPGRGWRFPLM